MTQHELAPISQFGPIDLPLSEAAPISDFEHRLNYGRAALSGLRDRFTGFVESVATKIETVPAVVSSAIETLPNPTKITRALGATAMLLPGVVMGTEHATASSAKPAMPKIVSTDPHENTRLFAPNLKLEAGRFTPDNATAIGSRTSNNSVTGGAANIKFYKGTSQKAIGMINQKFAECAPSSLISEPHPSYKDEGRDRNKTGVLRTLFLENGLQQKAKAVFRKGYRFCNLYVTTVGREIYFPPKRMIKKIGNTMTYLDPFKTNDPSNRAYGTLIVAAKKIKK